jgi:Spy/CpxP family protein refolding chaperone
MRTRALILTLVFSLAINVAVLATAGYHYYRNTCLVLSEPCPLSRENHHLYQALGLSDSQRSKMEPLARKFHARLEELADAVGGKRDSLVDLLAQKEVNRDRIERLQKEIAAVQGEIQKEVIVHIIELKDVLTPKQQQRFFDLLGEAMSRGEGPWLSKSRGT